MNILVTEKSKDYELLDSGNGEKLERYGEFVLRRPDPQVLWNKNLPMTEWEKADAVYTRSALSGKWETKKEMGLWNIELEGMTFTLKLLPSKHLGVFPEQSAQWKWLSDIVAKSVKENGTVSVLNLFGYTGGASIACALAGASVCHVDGSKFVVDTTKVNMTNSNAGDRPIRLIVDDVRKFVEREIKRGNKYDVVLMDPPVYGKGSEGQVWNIDEDLTPFLSRIKNIISEKPVAIVLNGYASIYSPITYEQMLSDIAKNLGGVVASGELAIRESSKGRLLPCGIFTRWSK